jgi:ABC-2 type transport system permease protein
VLVENLVSGNQFGDRLDSGKIRAVINIPSDFSEKIKSLEKMNLQIIVDGSDPTWAASALAYINAIVSQYQQEQIQVYFKKKGMGAVPQLPINLATRVWYNETLRSVNFFIPGLICVILMQMSATLTSLTIVSEKEQGTMEALVVSPIRKNELMLGKVIPYVLVAFVDVLIITAIGVFWFGVPFKGSFLLLILGSFIFLTGAMAIGVLISTNAHSSQEAMQAATLMTMLPSLLLSGLVFPIENMPWLLQLLSYLIPARYFLTILRGIFLKGTGLNYLWPEFLMMLTLSTLVITLSVRRFKKRIE